MYVIINDIFKKYNNFYLSDETEYWFDKSRYEFYSKQQIKEFGYTAKSQKDLIQLLQNVNIIPSFSLNEVDFKRKFIDELRNKKLSEYFSQFTDDKKFDSMFDLYVEENNIISYIGYENINERLKSTAIEWCKKNNINYRLK